MTKFKVFIFLLLLFALCNFAFGQTQGQEDAKLTALVRQMVEAQRNY